MGYIIIDIIIRTVSNGIAREDIRRIRKRVIQ